MASVVVRAAEVIAKGSGVPLWQRRSARAMVAGGSRRSHAIDEEARLAGSDQPFVTLMNQLLRQRAIEYDEEFPRKTACIDIFRQKSTELSFN